MVANRICKIFIRFLVSVSQTSAVYKKALSNINEAQQFFFVIFNMCLFYVFYPVIDILLGNLSYIIIINERFNSDAALPQWQWMCQSSNRRFFTLQ